MSLPTAPPTGTGRSARDVWLVSGVAVLADQASKAAADDHIVNEGGTGYLLPDGLRLLWAHPHLGAVLDLVDVLPLVLLLMLALRADRPHVRAAWALLLAGWASNWADRLGLSALTQPGSSRGVVDWIRIPGLPGVWNLADVLIITGALVLTVHGARLLGKARPVLLGTLCLCLLAAWVGVWSGDRRAEESAEMAARLRHPVAAVDREHADLERRAQRAWATAASEGVRTARAALAARVAGEADAQDLLPTGYWFACAGDTRCVVVAPAGTSVRIVYPLRRPVWAARMGLPLGTCDVVSDQVSCEDRVLTSTVRDTA